LSVNTDIAGTALWFSKSLISLNKLSGTHLGYIKSMSIKIIHKEIKSMNSEQINLVQATLPMCTPSLPVAAELFYTASLSSTRRCGPCSRATWCTRAAC
jgi:hypothetical protein